VLQKEQVSVPPLKFWEPAAVSATAASNKVTLTWDALTGADSYTALFSQDGKTVWQQAAQSGDALDARALEGTTGLLTVNARDSAGSGTYRNGELFELTFTSQAVGYPAVSVGLPKSRGKGCTVEGKEGPVAEAPCKLTNGDLFDTFTKQPLCASGADAGVCTSNRGVTVDLGDQQSVSAIFVRGLSARDGARVESSVDGVIWIERGKVDPQVGFASIVLNTPAPMRHVRVRAPDGKALDGLHELSIW
jgi:hypothetical protein